MLVNKFEFHLINGTRFPTMDVTAVYAIKYCYCAKEKKNTAIYIQL